MKHRRNEIGFLFDDSSHDYLKISQIKFKVFERSTGNEQQEEWLVLPENLLHREDYYAYDFKLFFSWKNFVAIEIEMDDEVFLILNLATRKRYWMKFKTLHEKIFAKMIHHVDLDGDPYDFDLIDAEIEIRQMTVNPNRIEMKYHMRSDYDTYDDMALLFIG